MDDAEWVGWLAASLTLLAFSMRSMPALRLTAICANICFMLYGWLSGLRPVMVRKRRCQATSGPAVA